MESDHTVRECIASFVGILQKKVIEAVMDLISPCQALSVVIL